MNSTSAPGSDQSSILAKDQQYVWHPYSSLTDPIPAYEVVSAEGVYLHLAYGTVLIDGMSSWWCTIHGYNHPVLNQAAKKQIDKVSHVMFGGITHAPAVDLCEKLVQITPDGLEKVFLADSGSVGVEVAIKMAFQYWLSKGQPQKNKLLSLRNGYHGDTFAAMSVCDPVTTAILPNLPISSANSSISLPRLFWSPLYKVPAVCVSTPRTICDASASSAINTTYY